MEPRSEEGGRGAAEDTGLSWGVGRLVAAEGFVCSGGSQMGVQRGRGRPRPAPRLARPAAGRCPGPVLGRSTRAVLMGIGLLMRPIRPPFSTPLVMAGNHGSLRSTSASNTPASRPLFSPKLSPVRLRPRQKNEVKLTDPNPKPTLAWLGGGIARSGANPHPGPLPLGR